MYWVDTSHTIYLSVGRKAPYRIELATYLFRCEIQRSIIYKAPPLDNAGNQGLVEVLHHRTTDNSWTKELRFHAGYPARKILGNYFELACSCRLHVVLLILFLVTFGSLCHTFERHCAD